MSSFVGKLFDRFTLCRGQKGGGTQKSPETKDFPISAILMNSENYLENAQHLQILLSNLHINSILKLEFTINLQTETLGVILC